MSSHGLAELGFGSSLLGLERANGRFHGAHICAFLGDIGAKSIKPPRERLVRFWQAHEKKNFLDAVG